MIVRLVKPFAARKIDFTPNLSEVDKQVKSKRTHFAEHIPLVLLIKRAKIVALLRSQKKWVL